MITINEALLELERLDENKEDQLQRNSRKKYYRLVESKQDELKLVNVVGEKLAQQFLDNRKRFPSPYNDIYYWVRRSPMELINYLNSFNSIRDKKENGIELVYQDNNWKIFKVLSYEASKKYGAKTRWCISGTRTYKSGKTGQDYFNEYKNYGVPIYFFISQRYGKYALCDMKNGFCQIFDDQDNTVAGIPNLPDVEELEYINQLEPITLTRVYEDDVWQIDQPDNSQWSSCAIIACKGDEEEAYRYDIYDETFVPPSLDRKLSMQQFSSISEEHEELAKKLQNGEIHFS